MKDDRVNAIREKDAVIATYNAATLIQSPEVVDERYSQHANTHIAMGDTSAFVDKLIHWTRHNKGCVVGAIVGPYGYGKTSTAVHLWHECAENQVIAVPPFTWFPLSQLIDATYIWVRYQLAQLAPDACSTLQSIYEKYRTKSLEGLAAERGIPKRTLEGMLRDGLLKLETKPGDVVSFLSEINRVLTSVGRDGPIVFIDELQETLSQYPTRDQFMEDLFGLLNELHQRQGSYGMVISMPTATEALIQDVRGDIIQRMQAFNFYLRPETMYGREFAENLWRKFATLFKFTDVMSQILPQDTLKSIGQIAARKDLGAGPRTVVDSFHRAVDYYESSNNPYTPINLVDDYIRSKVAFDQNGKLGTVVSEALSAVPVAGDAVKERAIKLLGAFPEGCPDEVLYRYDVADIIENLPSAYRREYVYDFAEGPSLRKLARTEVKPDPVYLRLIKEFIGRYREDDRHAQMALTAFNNLIINSIVFTEHRGTATIGWRQETPNTLTGTFNDRYPERQLYLQIELEYDKLDTNRVVDEFGLWIHFDSGMNQEDVGEVRRITGAMKTLLRLNARFRSTTTLNIPYLNDLGLSATKLTPMFMLALLQHLELHRSAIPDDEQMRGMKSFTDNILSNALRLLFNNELREESDWKLTHIGQEMIQDIFNQMCESAYPNYKTLMTGSGWEKNLTVYINALQQARITAASAQGQQPLNGSKEEIMRIFGHTSSQPFQNMQRMIQSLLRLEKWPGRTDEPAQVSLTFHPLERTILDALNASHEKIWVESAYIEALSEQTIQKLCRRFGYRSEEVSYGLQLLKARRMVGLDKETKKYYRILNSPTVIRDRFFERLVPVRQFLQDLDKHDTGFDTHSYNAQLDNLKRRVVRTELIPELEDIVAEIDHIRSKVEQDVEQQIRHLQATLENQRKEANRKGSAVFKWPDLMKDSPWICHAETIKVIIDKQHAQPQRDVAKALVEQIDAALEKSKAAEHTAIKLGILVHEYKLVQEGQKRYEYHRNEFARLGKQYSLWPTLIITAARIQHDAENCATTYNLGKFIEKYDTLDRFVSAEISAGRWIELAPKAQKDLEQIEQEIKDWMAGPRDRFIHTKAHYEQWLSRVSGRAIHLLINFDPYRPSESFQSLEDEVKSNLTQLIRELSYKLNRAKSDRSYLALLLKDQASTKISEIHYSEYTFDQLQLCLQNDSINQILESWPHYYETAREHVATLLSEIANLLVKQAPHGTEKQILAALSAGRTLELGEIIRLLAQQQGRDTFSLKQLMLDIQNLFLKNQIVIKVERRP